jgi:hypothetical protein
MKRCSMMICFAVLAVSTASAQEKKAVPPPPKPADEGSSLGVMPAGADLASTMKAIEDRLRSTGRITWTQNTMVIRPIDNGVNFENAREKFSEQVTNVTADSRNCFLKVLWQTNGKPSHTNFLGQENSLSYSINGSYYFEEIANVNVVASEDFQPVLYSVDVTTWDSDTNFKFLTREAAEQFAALLRESISKCSVLPVASRPAQSADPGLDQTLAFIAEKLTNQGRVEARWADVFPGVKYLGSPPITSLSVNYFQVTSSPSTCIMSFDSVDGSAPKPHASLSLRRIGRLELLPLKDYLASYTRTSETIDQDKLIRKEVQAIDISPSFVLKISSPGIESKLLHFSDEALANRVAKAINHAAELCGVGSKPEPF